MDFTIMSSASGPHTTSEPLPEGSEVADPQEAVDLTIVVPAFNEEGGIVGTIQRIEKSIEGLPHSAEIVVVDDGSEDGTAAAAESCGVRVIRLRENGGYGDALKTGIAASQSKFVGIIDADGTYDPKDFLELMKQSESTDMVVGSRALNSANIPLVRRPAKWFLGWLAQYLAGRRIPDLNSGLRVMRRSVLTKFISLLPSGFSFTTTITLCMMCTGHQVAYVPIDYGARIGRSKIRPVDFINFLILVLRTIVLFNPLRVFVPIGLLLFVFGLVKFAYDVFIFDLSESAVMSILGAIMVWSLGLLADMISRLHLGSRSSF